MSRKPVPMLTQRESDIEPDRRPVSLQMYKRMFGYTRPYGKVLLGLLFCVVMRGAQLPLLSRAFSAVINGPIKEGRLTGLLFGVAGYMALAIFTQYTLYHRMRLALLLGEGVVHDLRADIFDRMQRLTMSFFSRTRLGRIISRVTSDAEVVRAGIQDAVFVGMVCAGQILISAAIMVWQDRSLFLVVLCTAPAYFITYHYFREKLIRVHREVQESYSRLTATLAESV